MARSWSEFGFTAFCFISIAVLLYQSFPLLFGGTDLVVLEMATSRGDYAVSYGNGTHWKGWPGVGHLFIFGDSWTTTGFEIDQPQPTVENPIGNPHWDPANWHLGAGSNWVGFITARHNESLVLTVNLAYGGATVDMDLIHPFEEKPPGMRDLGFQINEMFKPMYETHPDYFDWTDENSLFIIWIGLNDIHNANAVSSLRFGMVFEQYANDVDELYQMGARNFMFMNIPPIEHSPLAPKENMVEDWTAWVSAWNKNITALASNFTRTYSDATTFVFDTYHLFRDVMENPCTHPETCDFKDTTTFCPDYAFGTEEWYSKSPDCEYRVDEYLWMNDIHPTTRMHNLTAVQMAKALMVE